MTNKHSAKLIHPSLRSKIPPSRNSYYHTFERGRALGYYKSGANIGYWSARIQTAYKKYKRRSIGLADDLQAADDKTILSFEQALGRAREWCNRPEQRSIASEPRPTGRVSHLMASPLGSGVHRWPCFGGVCGVDAFVQF